MPYQVAAETPLPPIRAPWSDRVYARHGITPVDAGYWRSQGVPASVAVTLARVATAGERHWLTHTFSTVGLRRLVAPERDFGPAATRSLRAAAGIDLSRTRAYVSATTFPCREIEHLVALAVPVRAARTWQTSVPLLRRGARLADLLQVAVVVSGVPHDQVAEWVRFAVRRGIVFDQQPGGPYRFLGGDTGLFVEAGISPGEARRMHASGHVDRAALRTLAALRARSSR